MGGETRETIKNTNRLCRFLFRSIGCVMLSSDHHRSSLLSLSCGNKFLHLFRKHPTPIFFLCGAEPEGRECLDRSGRASQRFWSSPASPQRGLKCYFFKGPFLLLGMKDTSLEWHQTASAEPWKFKTGSISLSLGKTSLNGTCDSSVAVVFSKLIPLLLGTLKVFRA